MVYASLDSDSMDPSPANTPIRRVDLQRRDQLPATARRYFEALKKSSDPNKRADYAMMIGVIMETLDRFGAAVKVYKYALIEGPSTHEKQYYARNNLGFSLNQLGKFEEGEILCREAIELDQKLPNAHKNLGLSLWGQKRYVEAAYCFVNATEADARDPRSTKHLEDLLSEHQELAEEFATQLDACKQAVNQYRRSLN
jgi:tetratricopeptide (TPR) repeat protein